MKKKTHAAAKHPLSAIDTILLHEQESVLKLRQILANLQEKYKVSSLEILESIKKEIVIPVSVFTRQLTVLETIVKYLKEQKNYSYHQIAFLLDRDEKNIWHAYFHAQKKRSKRLTENASKYFVPVSIFRNTPVSILEALVVYLKEHYGLSYHEIAVLVKRDDRTIWTVYHRAKIKT